MRLGTCELTLGPDVRLDDSACFSDAGASTFEGPVSRPLETELGPDAVEGDDESGLLFDSV